MNRFFKLLGCSALLSMALASCQGNTNRQADTVTTVPDTIKVIEPQDQTEVGTRRSAGSGILGTGTSARTADTIRPLSSQVDSAALPQGNP